MQNEVLHAYPVSSVPKNNLKAPPLDPANPTPAHNWLPVPSSSAKLKSSGNVSSSGTPTSPSDNTIMPSAAAHTIPGPQIFGRFPPSSQHLSEQDLDPYFINFEASSRELELLLQGSIEKVNRRTLEHLTKLSADFAELGARYNGFSLSEQSPMVAAAIERVGQACDNTYLETEALSSDLGASFAEPMRESAQFAGVVRSVLRYRVLKRVQQEMTRDELDKKKTLLDSLERSEIEAKRIDAYLSSSISPQNMPKRSTSSASQRSNQEQTPAGRRQTSSEEETASLDSDFPPTHGDTASSIPSAEQGTPQSQGDNMSSSTHKKSQSGNFVTNKIFGSFRHAVNGFVDVDPERTRRDQIGKTKESLVQLEQALEVSEKDVKDASAGILKDLKRFQKEKEDDLQRYMVSLFPTREVIGKLTSFRSHMPSATLNGPKKTSRHGRRLRTLSLRFILNRRLPSRLKISLMPTMEATPETDASAIHLEPLTPPFAQNLVHYAVLHTDHESALGSLIWGTAFALTVFVIISGTCKQFIDHGWCSISDLTKVVVHFAYSYRCLVHAGSSPSTTNKSHHLDIFSVPHFPPWSSPLIIVTMRRSLVSIIALYLISTAARLQGLEYIDRIEEYRMS